MRRVKNNYPDNDDNGNNNNINNYEKDMDDLKT